MPGDETRAGRPDRDSRSPLRGVAAPDHAVRSTGPVRQTGPVRRPQTETGARDRVTPDGTDSADDDATGGRRRREETTSFGRASALPDVEWTILWGDAR